MTKADPLSPLYRRVAIFVLAFAAYAPTLRVGFLWDDHVMIEGNAFLEHWTAANIKHDFTNDVFDGHGNPYYRPAQTLANRVDYTLWGLRPFGYHLSNFLSHALNSILVSELTLVLGLGAMTALLAGCLFAVNPMVVEQLMIIAGRGELMSFTFMLLALLLLVRKSIKASAFATGAFAVALLFKESALILPFLAALLFYFRKEPRRAYARLLPLIVIAVPYLWLRARELGPVLETPDPVYLAKFFLMAFPKVLLKYAALIVFPWNLHSHRLMPHLTYFWPLLLVALAAGIFYCVRRDRRFALFCIGWYILVFLPKTPAMIYGNFMLDHWAYPAVLAIVVPLSAYFAHLWFSPRNRWQNLLAALYFPLLIYWALTVHLNVALRGTDEKMYRWALHFTTSNPIKYNLGILLLHTNRVAEALVYLEDAHDHYPEDSNNTNALAEAYWRIGNHNRSVGLLEEFHKTHPDDALTAHNLEAIQKMSYAKRAPWSRP